MKTIVTAADSKYWRSLYQFLLSAERAGLAGAGRFLSYDLGLDPASRSRLVARFPWCEFPRFNFEAYPSHVTLARRNYAWKVLLLSDLAGAGGQLLWFDSATLLHTRDFAPLWSRIRKDGVYVVKGRSTLEEHCDPLVLDALSVPNEIRQQPERVAGVIGFDCDKPAIQQLISEWRSYALEERMISPRTPPLSSHRFEQALLTILLHRYEVKGLLQLPDEEIDISSPKPIKWMSSRNKVPVWMPLWADPFVRLRYRVYKVVDQALWRRRLRSAD